MTDSVLVLSGLDPSGAAGIGADIETINQFGVTPLPIVTTLTAQNTESVIDLQEVDSKLIVKQFKHLQTDVDIKVVKIGLLSSSEQIRTIASLLKSCNNIIVILDPIIKASTNDELLQAQAIASLKQELLPLTSVITPNLSELQALAPDMDEQQMVSSLPCEWVLLTTTDSSDDKIEHRLYHQEQKIKSFYYHKLPGQYHGSGCTLTSAISSLIASGVDVGIACERALDYTYQTLLNAKSIGKMQYHPNRQKP